MSPAILVGYARVSTGEQKLDLQLDALRQAGCEKLFTDQISGARSDRPGLTEALDYVRAGDTLVVWRLDRFGRSLKDLVLRVEELTARDVGFRSLQESIYNVSRWLGHENITITANTYGHLVKSESGIGERVFG